jgi:peptide/nickel transport system permease protein
MGVFLLKRLGRLLLVLFAISVLVFLIFNVIPNSDPASRIAGKSATPELIDQVEETWGFDEPLPEQYLTMMKLIFTGELVSYERQLDVDEEIWKGLPATLSVCLGAAAIWLFFGVLVGYVAAFRAGRFTDRALMVLSLVSISLPIFLVSALALNYLSYKLELFPSSGYVGLTEEPLDWAYHLVLPWTTLAVLFIGLYARVLRANLLETMDEDYVRTARAKGLGERQVRLRHVLRNALLPIVTLLGLDFAALVGGAAIVTEYIFSLQGVGQLAADAVLELDLPPLMAVTMFAAFLVVLLNTLVDIAYTRLDPRIRLGSSTH